MFWLTFLKRVREAADEARSRTAAEPDYSRLRRTLPRSIFFCQLPAQRAECASSHIASASMLTSYITSSDADGLTGDIRSVGRLISSGIPLYMVTNLRQQNLTCWSTFLAK